MYRLIIMFQNRFYMPVGIAPIAYAIWKIPGNQKFKNLLLTGFQFLLTAYGTDCIRKMQVTEIILFSPFAASRDSVRIFLQPSVRHKIIPEVLRSVRPLAL